MARKYSRSRGNRSFSTVPEANIRRSVFDRSHGLKTTFNASELVPIYVDEGLPGDTFQMKMTAFARVATPIKPVMDNLVLESFFFAVPNRLLWDNWEKFCGYQANPGDSTDYTIPRIGSVDGLGVVEEGSVADYFGLPLNLPLQNAAVSALPFRAYEQIWNEWFRDENYYGEIATSTDDGPDNIDGFTPFFRGKRKDYFTGCLPWPQKGAQVLLPLGLQAPITGLGSNPGVTPEASLNAIETGGDTVPYANGWSSISGTSNGFVMKASDTGPGPDVYADLSNASAATINELREAFQTQRLLERDARGGTRYTEVIRAHFNVISPDMRLQRPEYLGGGRSYVNFSAVPQTQASSDGVTPQANLSAYGTLVGMGHGFTSSFTEHMTIIGLVNVRADLTYQQGINRMWSRETRYDFFWPALAHLGEQEVLSQEIYADGSPEDQDVFGYQERYAEYRYKPSMITGKFRSTSATPLDIWHLAQEFDSRPVLNTEFIRENVPMDRIKAVTDEPDFIGDFQFNLRCARPMPVYGVPGYIDHF